METRPRKQGPAPRRHRPAGVVPLELWDLRVPGREGILWDHMHGPEGPAVLRATLLELWAGRGTTRSEGATPASVHQFPSLYITGGGAPAVAAALAEGPWRLLVGRDPEQACAPGGHSILAAAGLRGWVLDLGQSALKISTAPAESGLRMFPRAVDVLPVRDDALHQSAAWVESQRRALRAFLAAGLRSALESAAAPPAGLVVALPSRLDDAGVPEGSSYIGMAGDVTLVADALHVAGLAETPAWVLNDAELAAATARLDSRLPPPGQGAVLVLTLGFGLGAALLQ